MRKVLVSLLVLAMVLGLVGSAYAYTDTSKSTAAQYIDKASALKWMTGYPDGTFKPTGNITRAEIAAVICRALGLEAAAASTAGLASKFSDVKSTHWAAGYVNVAVTKGIVKGYPDGTFKPEANVTGAEVITMIVRALNREVDAIGEWPVGHISVAASESIIGSGFVSNALATREQVATYFSKSADIVLKQLTTNGWVIPTDAPSQKTFLSYNNLTMFRGVVENTDTTNRTITVSGDKPGSYSLETTALVAGGTSLVDLKGFTVDLFKNNDTGKIWLIEPVTTVTSKSGTLRAIGTDYFYLNNDTAKYQLSKKADGVTLDAVVIRNATTMINHDKTDLVTFGKLTTDDEITFFIGQDGNVNYIKAKAYDFKRFIVQDTYTAGTPYSLTAAHGVGNWFVATDAKITKNGVEVPFSSIKKDDIASVALDATNTTVVNFIDATDKTVSGKVTAKRMDSKEDGNYYYLSIDGVEYRMETTNEIKDGVTGAANVMNQLRTGDVVKIYLSQRGRARVTEVTTGIADVGKLVSYMTNTGTYDKMVLDMRGVQTTYEVAKPADTSSLNNILKNGGATQVVFAGDYLRLAFDADGRLCWTDATMGTNSTHKILDGAPVKLGEVYTSDRLVTVPGGATYLGTDNTAVYVNGSYSSFGAIAKDQMAKIYFETTGGINKILAIAVDTYAKLDTSAVASVTGQVVYGGAGAAENNSVVTFWADAASAQAGTDTAKQYNVNWLKWNSADILTGKAAQTSVTADGPACTVWGQNAGDFRVQVISGGANAQITWGTATTMTVYMRVTDGFGNYTTAPITLVK